MLEFVGFAQQAVYRGMERELAMAEKRDSQGQAHVRIADFCEHAISLLKTGTPVQRKHLLFCLNLHQQTLIFLNYDY